MVSLKEQLELVQTCYEKVTSAHAYWNAYRRATGESGTVTPDLPEFVALLTVLTRKAEEISRRHEERRKRFDSVPVLQATLRFANGTTRKVVVSKPTDAIAEPHVGEMFYAALQKQGVVASLEAFPVLVVDRRSRVVATIPAATTDIML